MAVFGISMYYRPTFAFAHQKQERRTGEHMLPVRIPSDAQKNVACGHTPHRRIAVQVLYNDFVTLVGMATCKSDTGGPQTTLLVNQNGSMCASGMADGERLLRF